MPRLGSSRLRSGKETHGAMSQYIFAYAKKGVLARLMMNQLRQLFGLCLLELQGNFAVNLTPYHSSTVVESHFFLHVGTVYPPESHCKGILRPRTVKRRFYSCRAVRTHTKS